MTKIKKTTEKKLVFAFGYLMDYRYDPNADYPGALPRGITSGYYVGFTTKSPGGSFRDIGSLKSACAEAAEASKVWSIPVDMNFEGLVRTKTLTVLLQPIEEDPENYKSVDELLQKYLPAMKK